MTGVPWELEGLPGGKKHWAMKPKDRKLDTIDEWLANNDGTPYAPEYMRRDTATSAANLTKDGKEGGNANVNKVQKGQINALAKMLSALRHT